MERWVDGWQKWWMDEKFYDCFDDTPSLSDLMRLIADSGPDIFIISRSILIAVKFRYKAINATLYSMFLLLSTHSVSKGGKRALRQ